MIPVAINQCVATVTKMVDIPMSPDGPEKKPRAGPGHVKNMIHLFSNMSTNGYLVNGSDVSRQSPPHSTSQQSPSRTSPVSPRSPSLSDSVDTDVKTNYVTTQILSLEQGTEEINPNNLKKVSDKPPSYLKLSCSASGYQQNGISSGHRHETPPRGSSSDSCTRHTDKLINGGILTNGHIEGHELSRSNGYCDLDLDTVDSHSVINISKSSCHHGNNGITTNGASTYKKDGAYFLQIVDAEDRKLKCLVTKTEVLLQTADIPEDACGILRSVVGKTNLLITNKFPHFRGFCDRNLKPREDEKMTTDTDLEGLWDIVAMQVDEITHMHKQIDNMKRSGWTNLVEGKENQSPNSHKAKANKSPVKKGKSPRGKDSTDSAAAKSREEARTKAREEAKRRLMAAKKAGRQRKASQSDEVEIFVQT